MTENTVIGSKRWKSLREAAANMQHGLCAICQGELAKKVRGPQLDHEHATGDIRGALCLACNVKLAYVETHRAAIDRYLSAPTFPPGQHRAVTREWKKRQITDEKIATFLGVAADRISERQATFAWAKAKRQPPQI